MGGPVDGAMVGKPTEGAWLDGSSLDGCCDSDLLRGFGTPLAVRFVPRAGAPAIGRVVCTGANNEVNDADVVTIGTEAGDCG